jgi:hypothetical protein
MPPGLVIIVAVLMALAVQLIRLRPSVPMRAAGPDRWPGGCGCGSGDMMSAFTTNDGGPAGPGRPR